MDFSKKEMVLWGGTVAMALILLVVWYGWLGGKMPSGNDMPCLLSCGGDHTPARWN